MLMTLLLYVALVLIQGQVTAHQVALSPLPKATLTSPLPRHTRAVTTGKDGARDSDLQGSANRIDGAAATVDEQDLVLPGTGDERAWTSEWAQRPLDAREESGPSKQRDQHVRKTRSGRAKTVEPQNTHDVHSHHHHHHTQSHQEQRARRRRNHHHPRQRHQRPAHHQSLARWQRRRSLRLQFSQPEYRLTLREDVPIHTSLLTVGLEGASVEERAALKYYLSDSVNFGIDSTGVIYTLRRLDHEATGGRYLLQVTAKERGGDKKWPKPTTKLNLEVMDAPEPPRFDSEHYQFTVSEFAREGSYVGTVRANDDDGDLDRYFLHGAEFTETFSIDAALGVITLEEAPDGSRWEFHFQVGATDQRGHVALVPVSVFVLTSNPSYARLVSVAQGDNSHRPVFRDCESYDDVHVMENVTAGSPVLMVVATDQDSGPSGSITYHLIHSFSSFTIQASHQHGQITTTRRLDRDEGDQEFLLTVVAKDGGSPPLQASCSFRVIVDDLNDNPPVFDQTRYEQALATDHDPALPVLRVSASDRDAGRNAHVTYHLEGHPNHLEFFYLEPITGVLSLKRLLTASMANTKTFDVRVRAVDGGTPPLWSTAPITVRVVSSGEVPPSLAALHPRQPAIPENTTENTDVVVVCARSNLVNAPNVYFTLLNGDIPETNSDGTFAIRRVPDHQAGLCGDGSGVSIFVATRNLDFETLQAYRLNLQMVNDRNARLEQQVVVDIVDVNDNAPLLQAWDGAVLENTAGALITTIQAVDKDASPQYRQLSYSFDSTAPHDVVSKFALKTNGELWSTQPLDREEVGQYRVPIQVTDGVPEHARMTTYWITVQDLNDVPPAFDRSLGVYEVQLPENREVGKPTGIRLAVDDADVVNQFTFAIVSGNEAGKFRIDTTSRTLVVNAPLDYDHPVNDRNFTLRIRVSDGTNAPALTDVVVAVANVNDLPPVFQRDNYSFVVTENTDCSVALGQVSALDPDLPPSAPQDILYYLSPDEQRNFTIDSRSGHLSVRGCLDRETTARGTMTLYARANDEGGKGHDADPATVQVTILDLNDNYPHFVRPPQGYARVMENLEPHLVEPVVLQLGDADTEENGCPCSLEFHASTPAAVRDKFTLTPLGRSRYRLSPVVVLDRERQKIYHLAFTARDRAGVGGTRHLTVEVSDENDSPMTDGASIIRVYNYQGQFPAMVVGSVHVTDSDDHDRQDKTFQLEPSTDLEAAAHFKVDLYTGDITMLRGTPVGTHTLKVTVYDSFREEVAIGETNISVVDLTQEALTQSGSLRLANTSARAMLQQTTPGSFGTSLYERLKKQIANIHQISEDEVDVFLLRDAPGDLGVDVRYNCHKAPFYSASRLDGLLLGRRQQVSAALGVDIPLVDINACLYEVTSPCGGHSCQHTLRPNLTAPILVSGVSASLVGVDIVDDYTCTCGALEPPPSVCYPGFCFNGGLCSVKNNTLTCKCPDSANYGPRCELLTARFENNFAWYEPLTVCERSSLSFTFETHDKNGVLLYTGPTVPSPWPEYPRDFLYIILRDWVIETFLDLGTGTMNLSIPIEASTIRTFKYVLLWGEGGVTAEVVNCGINITRETSHGLCRKSIPLARLSSSSSPSHLLNTQGPVQVGGVASMVSFLQLADSYGWSLTPPSTSSFSGCMLELRHNDRLYDLNATDFGKQAIQPCDAPRTSRVVLGRHSIIIILASLLCLLLLVVVILCLARRGRKSLSYPELDRELVKETMGDTDLEGFGEKDVTHFDLKFLQVTPDGYLVGDENEGTLPDVAQDACQKDSSGAPVTQLPEGLSIRDFIKENIVKVDQQHQDLEDVRHYCVEGDEMSAASLSSLTSGSSRGDMIFDYRTDWGQKFEKLTRIYGTELDADEDEDEDAEDDSPNKPSRSPAFLPRESTSNANKSGDHNSPPSPAPPSPTSSSLAAGSGSSCMSKTNPERPHVPVIKSIASESPAPALQGKSNNSFTASTFPTSDKTDASSRPSSLKSNSQKVDPPSVSGSPGLKAPSSSLLCKQQLNGEALTASRQKSENGVTTINNLYTNPAQRSSATTKTADASTDRPSETSKEPVVNGHLISIPDHRQCSEKASPQLSSTGNKKCDNKVTTGARSVKGVETWC